MDGSDEALDPVRLFTLHSFRMEPESWQQLVSENEVTLNTFFNSQDYMNLYIHRHPDTGLSASLKFPEGVKTKVICISKTDRLVLTKENVQNSLRIQEVPGDDILRLIVALSEVTCRFLSNPENSGGWAVGVADEALRLTERLKNEALVTQARIEGRTYLHPPDCLHGDGDGEQTSSHAKLLHACDSTIIEWAELVSNFLQQDSSQPLLDGLKPLPSEEFHFWSSRLKNLQFIQQQLQSRRAQQVESILETADSVYLNTLRDIHSDVQEGLREAEDVTLNLRRVQEKLEEVEQMEYEQLQHNTADVMEEVRLLWIGSEFYCKPCRVVVLLQEVCNLFIQQSRSFLLGAELLGGLVSGSGPGPVLQRLSVVDRTLKTFRQDYSQTRTRLDQGGNKNSWDFPSRLVFCQLDNFLLHLHKIQEAFRVSLQFRQLDGSVLGGASSRRNDEVQQVYNDFLGHVTVLSDCSCDPTDPDSQTFQLFLDQFQQQVSGLERRLVSVLSRTFEDCIASSAAKVVQMFDFILDRPLIQDQLRPHLTRLLQTVLTELDQTRQVFQSDREKSGSFGKFTSAAAAKLSWCRQLRLRAESSLDHYRTIRPHLDRDSRTSQQIPQRCQQLLDALQDFEDSVRTDWSAQLETDCGFILEQPLIQHNQQGMLGVSYSHKLEAVLRELRCVGRWEGVKLRPLAAQLFARRDDIRQSHLSLSHMVSCYNEVVSDVLQVERPLIQDQLQDLNDSLSELQRNTWSCEGVQQLVQQHTDRVLILHTTVSEARANMDTMTDIIQGWAELHLLQRSGDSLLEGGATEQNCRHIREEGQELLRLTQANRKLYGADDSSEAWSRYLDHIDDRVHDGLFHLLLTALTYLTDNMDPQSGGGVFLAVSLELQETGSVFEPSVGGGLSDLLKAVMADVFAAAGLPPRISTSRHDNYQVSLQQNADLSALEQEVMRRLQQVRQEAERVRAGLDRYAHLWQSDRTAAMEEFLTYGRQLGAEEAEPEEATPTLKDFQREVESLHKLSTEVSHLDDVIILHGWLQVELSPFRHALLSIIQDWTHMYTQYLLDNVTQSLQQSSQRADDDDDDDDDDEDEESSSSFPLTETINLLEAAGVQLPEHVTSRLQC